MRLVEAAAGRRAETGLSEAIEARILEVDGERLRFTHPLLALGGLVARHTGATAVAPRAARRGRSDHGGTSAASRACHRPAEPRDRSRRRGGGRERARTGSTRCRRRAGRAGGPAHTCRGCRGRCAGASSTAPTGSARRATASRAIALLEQAREAAPPGPARAAVLVHLANGAEAKVRAKRSTSIARRSPRLKATRPRGRDSPQPRQPREGHRGTSIVVWHTPSWQSRPRHVPGTPRSGAGRWRRSGSCTSAAGEAFRASRWRRRSRSSGRCRRRR